eukprot:8177649-Ditylum_brightwellii.AAC.1
MEMPAVAAECGRNWPRWLADVLPRQWMQFSSCGRSCWACGSLNQQHCVCLPTRCKAGGSSHPCTICNSLCGGEEGYMCVCLWSLAWSSQEDL